STAYAPSPLDLSLSLLHAKVPVLLPPTHPLPGQAKSPVVDRQAVVEGYLQCASACSHVPDLHLLFLLRLALAHRHLDPLGGAAEAGQCCVAAAAVALQYLLALRPHPHPPRDHP
ncbi:unnamed protein product, partial [Closterium sp. NIES-53]